MILVNLAFHHAALLFAAGPGSTTTEVFDCSPVITRIAPAGPGSAVASPSRIVPRGIGDHSSRRIA